MLAANIRPLTPKLCLNLHLLDIIKKDDLYQIYHIIFFSHKNVMSTFKNA